MDFTAAWHICRREERAKTVTEVRHIEVVLVTVLWGFIAVSVTVLVLTRH